MTLSLAILVGGCVESNRPLAPVTLPDLSRIDQSVRNQLHARHAAVERAKADTSVTAEDLAIEFGELGRLFLAAELPVAAEPCFVNAQTLAPSDGRWAYYLGHVYRTTGALTRAAASFDRAMQLQPNDLASLIWNGRIQLELGRPDAAEALFSRALAVRPGTFAAQLGLGRAALDRKEYARAIRELQAALATAPEASVVHYPLAMAYRGTGDHTRADAHMQLRGSTDVTVPDPLMDDIQTLLESPLAYQRRGLDAMARGAWNEAAAHFRRGIELAPAVPSLRDSLKNKLGAALFQLGDTAGARRQFEEGAHESPRYAPNHIGLGILMALSGHDNEAIRSLQTAVNADPLSVEAHLQLADALRRTGMFRESLEHYDRTLALDSRVSDAMFGSAMALVRLGRYADAVSRLTQGTKRHAEERRFRHALARLLATAPDAGARDGARAVSLLQELQAGGMSIDLAESIAMASAEVGRFSEAVDWQRQVIAAVKQSGADPRRVQALLATLARYERHQPSRTPWPPDDAIHRPLPLLR